MTLRMSSITRIKSFQWLQNYPLEIYFYNRNRLIGDVAQLVERVVRNDVITDLTRLKSSTFFFRSTSRYPLFEIVALTHAHFN